MVIRTSIPGLSANALKDKVVNKTRGQVYPSTPVPSETPWSLDQPVEKFWRPLAIQGERWLHAFPYRLMVISADSAGAVKTRYSARTSITASTGKLNGIPFDKAVVTPEDGNQWIYTLPITPQQLSIQVPYAINAQSTLRGVVEEHNGIKFKIIDIHATTGVFPTRQGEQGGPSQPTITQSVLSNVSEQFNIEDPGQAFRDLTNPIRSAVKGTHPNHPGEYSVPNSTELENTGYFNALKLGEFLDQYAQHKKLPENEDWRLVLDMPKRNETLIVTPISFTLKQDQTKPNEYHWHLQLKAWGRVNIDNEAIIRDAFSYININTRNNYQRIFDTIRATRRTLSRATNIVKAVRSDWRKPLDGLRQASLAVKDLGGLVLTTVDLPGDLIRDLKDAFEDVAANLSTSFIRPRDYGQSKQERAQLKAVVETAKRREGISTSQVRSNDLGSDAKELMETDTINSIFEEPESNFEPLDRVDLDSLPVNPDQQRAIDDSLDKDLLELNVDRLKGYKSTLKELSRQIVNNFGSHDPLIASLYNEPAPRERIYPMTIEENEIPQSIWESVSALDIMTATRALDEFDDANPMQFVGGLANVADIPFEADYTSKFLVPVPYGFTMEEIALRYLGSADKWIEIATLNQLRSPYIDETGFRYELVSNGDSRYVIVNDPEKFLFIGQKLTLGSSEVSQFTRQVINKEILGDTTQTLLTLNGLDDLESLKTDDGAYIIGYRPGTVNSQNTIYIPSHQPSEPDDLAFKITHLHEDKLTGLSKIDWRLTEDNDVAIDDLGNVSLANGYTNLIQALKIKLITSKGSLLRHPEFGLGVKPGISSADVSASSLFDDMQRMIQDDPRFAGLNKLEINLIGSSLEFNMLVALRNETGLVPITFCL